MVQSTRQEITLIVRSLGRDEDHRAATDWLFQVVQRELRRLASDLLRRERPGHTLQSTALVHEVYLRLADDSRLEWQNRAHFFGIAARAMRQVLVDHARRRGAAKRGGSWQQVTLNDDLELGQSWEVEILDLDRTIARLAKKDERMAQIVELRVFAGMSVKEVAHVLGLSRQTVNEDWRFAKLWLRHELGERTDS